jgi:hypothetical protein
METNQQFPVPRLLYTIGLGDSHSRETFLVIGSTPPPPPRGPVSLKRHRLPAETGKEKSEIIKTGGLCDIVAVSAAEG